MKKYLFLVFPALVMAFAACKDHEDHTEKSEYHINILSPDASDKKVGDEISLKIEFEEHHGGTIHHIRVRIFNISTGAEIYRKPAEEHIHKESPFVFEDKLKLNVDPNTEWVLEAKVWGHDDGVSEVTQTLAFSVKP